MKGKQNNHTSNQLEYFYRSEKRHLREKYTLLSALEHEFGSRVREIVTTERKHAVRLQWEEISRHVENNSIKKLLEILWEPMNERGIVEYELVESSNEYTCLKVTSCLFAQLVHELRIPSEWGYDLYCSDDEHMVSGFNPKMEFNRSKTLMEGNECCNHCYRLVG